MKKFRWWWLGGGLLALVALAGFQVYQGFMLMLRATDQAQDLIIPVQRLTDYGIAVQCGEPCVKLRRGQVSGALEIDYQYDNTQQPDEEDLLYVSSQAYVDLSALHAAQTFWMYRGGMHLGLMQGDATLTLQEVPAPPELGDQRYWARLSRPGGEVVGDVVVIRQGRIVLAYVVSGLHFPTPADIEKLMRPALDKATLLQES